jgi:para-nitrobenzyl esterase
MGLSRLYWSAAICLAFCLPQATLPLKADSVSAPVVKANGETLKGAWTGGGGRVAEFRGVPFAAPPTGDLRWRAPRPNTPRPGLIDATTFAPACMQGSSGVDWYVGVAAAFGHGEDVVARPRDISEDCLYLNIWSPRPDGGAKLPVMVFVHGGGNSGGWSYEPNYLGHRLASRGVVVVTIAYRLGPFGFFAHPSLQNGEDEPAANFGLLDIRAAFRWVHDHIGAFGGDAENITGFGESAGAFNLVDLLLVDSAAGQSGRSLFSRLIVQSIGGSLVERQSLQQEQAAGKHLARQLGHGAEASAAELRRIPAKKLVEASAHLPEDHYPDAVVDGLTVLDYPLEALRRAQTAGIELIVGSNADEWYMYLEGDTSIEDLESWIDEHAPADRDALLAAVADRGDARQALDWLSAGHDMRCPGRFLAQRINAGGGKAWVYRFTRQREGPGGDRLRAYHGAELPYVFGTHDDWLPTLDPDLSLTEAMMDYWVEFARTGDPNRVGRPSWPLHLQADPAVLEFGDRVGLIESDPGGLCALIGPQAVNGEREK